MENTDNILNPTNAEPSKDPSSKPVDVYSHLLRQRIVTLGSEVRSDSAGAVVAQLMYLDSLNDKPITLIVSSPGGSVYDGMQIVDTMNFINSPVVTICPGSLAMSMGALILSAGEKGMRYAFPNSRIMIHQVSGGFQGQASDIKVQAEEAVYLRHRLDQILADNCDAKIEDIRELTERDHFMSAEEALKLGLIDKVITTRSEQLKDVQKQEASS